MKTIVWMMVAALVAVGCGGETGTYQADAPALEDYVAPNDMMVPDVVAVDLAESDEEAPPLDLVLADLTQEQWQELYGEQCPMDGRVGLVEVLRTDWGQVTQARFMDQVVSAQVFQEQAVSGPCLLLNRAAPECTPECNQQKEQCALDESCVPLPVLLDVGAVVVSGLNFETVMDPKANNDYSKFDYPQEPVFDPGSFIAVTAPGGDFGPISLQGQGVADLVLVAPPESLSKDTSLDLGWEVSDGPGEIFVQVSLENHATTPLTIQCQLPDEGGIQVPAAFVNALLEAWVAGTVVVSVQRRTVDAEDYKTGCIEFQVYSDLTWDLQVL